MEKIVKVGYGKVKKVEIGGNLPLVFVGGPCAIETRDHAMLMAEKIATICTKLDIPWIYKSCYDKDCRSSPKSFHGVGLSKGLKILAEVRDQFKVPVVSDFSMEDMIAEEEVVITITHQGYIKRTALNTYRTQRRGGRGVQGAGSKEEDFVEHLFIANTHNCLLYTSPSPRD